MTQSFDPVAQGAVPAIGIPTSQDTARLVFSAPYFETVPIAEIIAPSVLEAVEAVLPALVPPYVDGAAQAAVQQSAVLLTGSTMSGPLNLNPLLPTADHMAATKAYVDTMVSTAGVPEVPTVPVGQSWVRQVGQWMPLVDDPGGPFLALSGGVMQGQINMGGNAILNLPAVPVMPNGAAPATWVLNQIASVSLYQGVWNLDTMTPDLTAPGTHINGYTWIAITNAPAGVVVGPAVPGLQGLTVYNGDTVIFSAAQGQFSAIHAGGLTAPQADARYVMLTGSQMSGALLLSANATQPTQAVTLQQLTAFVPPGSVGEAPSDGQIYGRNGVTKAWTPALPLAGGVLTGALTLAGNATANLNPVPLQQMTAAISTAVGAYVPLAGGVTMTGLLTLSGNAGSNLNPVPLQQVNAMLNSYLPLAGGTLGGDLVVNGGIATQGAAAALVIVDRNNPAHFWRQYSAADTLNIQTDAGDFMILDRGGGGSVKVIGGINTSGPVGCFSLNDRTTPAHYWVFYATGDLFKLDADSGPRFTIDRATGFMTLGGGLGASRSQFYVAGGSDPLSIVADSSLFARIRFVANNAADFYVGSEGPSGAFSIYQASGGAPTTRLTIDAANALRCQHVFPYVNNFWVCGGAGFPSWASVSSYAFANASDAALKDNIAPAPSALGALAALEPKTFTWKTGVDTERTHHGFLAQDVAAAFGEDFGGYVAPVPLKGDDGKETGEPGNAAIRYHELTAVLWQAVRELAAEVSALKAGGSAVPADA